MDKEEGDWQGAIEKAERWCGYTEYVHRRIWPLLPDIPENERTRRWLFRQVDELRRLWHTVARNAAGYIFAYGLPTDTGKVEDLQQWVDAAPREFEKDVAQLFNPRSMTRGEILERIRGLISAQQGECNHPRELAEAMRIDDATEWTESMREIRNLTALTSIITRPWSAMC